MRAMEVNEDNPRPVPSPSHDDLPPDLSCGQFDAVIFSCDEDSGFVNDLVDVLQSNVQISEGGNTRPADICTLDDHGKLSWCQSWFERLDQALERSTYSFFLITKSLSRKETAWIDTKRDEALMKMLSDKKYKYTVIPLHTVPKSERYG